LEKQLAFVAENLGTLMRERIINLLGRVTSGQRLIPEIDGLRFFAIATVVAYHANIQACRTFNPGIEDSDLKQAMSASVFTEVLARGDVGVPVFFAISGFILALPFARHYRVKGAPPVRLRPYFERRLSRLEVPYLAALGVAFAAKVFTGGGWAWSHLVASALYIHMFVFGEHSTINPVAWSLEIEVCFYCMAPVLVSVFALRSMAARITLMLIVMAPSIVMRTLFDEELASIHLDQTILGYGFYFLVGFVALELFMSGYFTRGRGGIAFDLAGVIAMVALLWPGDQTKLQAALVFVPACLALFAAAFRGFYLHAFFTNAWVVVLGGMCYSIYLLHYGVMIFATKAIGKFLVVSDQESLVTFAFLVIIVPISVAPCVVFYLLIEKPCMQRGWYGRLLGRLQRLSADIRELRKS
jgi:peptidoglycan/LPS O-acetylase OafA/YrhL